MIFGHVKHSLAQRVFLLPTKVRVCNNKVLGTVLLHFLFESFFLIVCDDLRCIGARVHPSHVSSKTRLKASPGVHAIRHKDIMSTSKALTFANSVSCTYNSQQVGRASHRQEGAVLS